MFSLDINIYFLLCSVMNEIILRRAHQTSGVSFIISCNFKQRITSSVEAPDPNCPRAHPGGEPRCFSTGTDPMTVTVWIYSYE